MGRRFILIVLGLAVLVLIVVVFHLPVAYWLRRLFAWTAQLGPWGPLVLAGLYIIAGVLLLPGSILTLGAGFLYGVPLGFVIVWAGNTLGACAAFLVGRTLARDRVTRRLANNEKFTAMDRAVGEHGFKIVLLTRLSPVFPYSLLNYAFGATRVSLRKYALASWIGLVPGILMYVYIGAGLRPLAEAAADLNEHGEETAVHRIFFWFGLVVTVALAAVVTHIARKALTQDLGAASAEEDRPRNQETDR